MTQVDTPPGTRSMALDKLWRGIGGRKFLAWLGSCGLLVAGMIDQDTWMGVTQLYIGGQTAVDIAMYVKGLKKPSHGTETEEG